MEDEIKINILYDHYKETYKIVLRHIKLRNRFFAITVVVLAIQILLGFDTNGLVKSVVMAINEQYKLSLINQISIIQSILWVILLYVTMRYYQESVSLERSYNYIHQLEKTISVQIESTFDRESGNYLQDYPLISNIINCIYRVLFPIGYVLLLGMIIVSVIEADIGIFCKIVDLICCLLCLILTATCVRFFIQ